MIDSSLQEDGNLEESRWSNIYLENEKKNIFQKEWFQDAKNKFS